MRDEHMDGHSEALREAARDYLRRGWRVVPLEPGAKSPARQGWTHLRLEASEVEAAFAGAGNLGLLMGEPSGGLVDVDCDAAEAVRAAALLLPPTGRVHGRAGKPASHCWYVAEGEAARTAKFAWAGAEPEIDAELHGGQRRDTESEVVETGQTTQENSVQLRENSVPSVLKPSSPAPSFATVLGGVDWGYTNPTAAVVFGVDRDGRAWQLDEWYQRRAPFEAVVLPALLDLTRHYGVAHWYCGPDEPEHIAALKRALRLAGLPSVAVAGDNAVQPGIQTVLGLLGTRDDGTRGLYVARRCAYTLAEYASYQYPPEPQAGYGAQWGSGGLDGLAHGLGAEASELPLKRNDHALDATRYALHTYFSRTRATHAYLEVELVRRLRLREERAHAEHPAGH